VAEKGGILGAEHTEETKKLSVELGEGIVKMVRLMGDAG
jgi:hypothetical protein